VPHSSCQAIRGLFDFEGGCTVL